MTNEVPLVVEIVPDGTADGVVVPATEVVVDLLVVAGVVLGEGLTVVVETFDVLSSLSILNIRIECSQTLTLMRAQRSLSPRLGHTVSTTRNRHYSGSRKRRSRIQCSQCHRIVHTRQHLIERGQQLQRLQYHMRTSC